MFGPKRSPIRRFPRLFLEELESRTLLSASSLEALVATPQAILNPAPQSSVSMTPDSKPGGGGGVTNPNPIGYSPSQIQTAYGFNQITFSNGTVPGNGSGQTIAIVDAYNDPNIKSDLSTFDSTFGLNAPPSFTVVNQSGGSKLPRTNSGWSLEISLDVEWAHAMAPGANILLVEASTNSLSNLLAAVSYAAQHASVVSMSWGAGEFSSETAYDSYFTQSGVTYVASSGDNGAPPIWPAISPNVVAVGGTTLTLNSSGGYGSETGWSGSGGGISAYEPLPAYQDAAVTNDPNIPGGTPTTRTNPDVAYNANPNTGFAVYDTVSYYGQTGWFEVGGTSAGAPQWSALVAIANQGRALAGQTSLGGNIQTLPALYNMSSSDFHDITSGTSTGTPNYSAGTGYDLVTGRGTPYANSVVTALVSATSTGSVGSLTTTTVSGSTSTSAKKAAVLGGDPAESLAGSGAVSLIGQVPAAADPAVLIQPTQTSTASIFPFGTASVLSSAFGAGQTLAVSSGTSTSQTSSASSAVLGFRLDSSAPKPTSSLPENLGNSLSPFSRESPDGVPLTGAEDTDELGGDAPLVPHQTLRALFLRALEFGLSPSFSAQEQAEEAPACDACFVDEAGMAFLADEGLAAANGENEESWQLRVPTMALMGVLASGFWMVPEIAEERRKRRALLPV